MNALPTSLYVHLPWCVRKCPYCDFNSHALAGGGQRGALPVRDYLAALQADLRFEQARFDREGFATAYFGGGTPSLFPPAAFGALLDAANIGGEVTMEANPGAAEHHDFAAYRRAGITRVSIGGQSFDPGQLRRLGRIHSADDTRRTARQVAAAGFESFNIDLMYGLPGQTVAAAVADLEQAIRLAPPHISWYQLTIEPNTAFARRPPPGLPDADHAGAMEDAGVAVLARHGYRRYEVSAYARPGHECAHNLNYWRFGDYAGIGAGAHGKHTVRGQVRRTAKPRQPRRFMADCRGETTPVPPDELAGEFMLNALRLADGVEAALFPARTGLPLARVKDVWDELVAWGMMRRDRLALTARGHRHVDGVVARFFPLRAPA